MVWRAGLLVIAATLTTGCAVFGIKPIPVRLSEEDQAHWDVAWEHMVSLGDEVDHTTLLDVLLWKEVWHAGVDHFYLRSEKLVGDVHVVMETRFDRTLPDEDVFIVTFYDLDGRLLRQDYFAPPEMDEAIALYQTPDEDEHVSDETPEQREVRMLRLVEREARMRRLAEVFPLPEEPEEPEEPVGMEESEGPDESQGP